MAENTIEPTAIENLIAEKWKATKVSFRGGAPIEDTFNEVSKMDPPDYAWYVLADVTTIEDGQEETTTMSFQIGEKNGKLDIYCTWDYDIFKSELAQIARDVIADMREEGWLEDDIKWSASGVILKHCEDQAIDFEPTKENMAAILALVKQVMKEDEPTLQQCPYCSQMHQSALIEQCSLKPLNPPHIPGRSYETE